MGRKRTIYNKSAMKVFNTGTWDVSPCDSLPSKNTGVMMSGVFYIKKKKIGEKRLTQWISIYFTEVIKKSLNTGTRDESP